MAICQCHLTLLPDSWCLCQSHWTPTSSLNSTMEATGSACKEDGWSAVIFPCHLHDLQHVLDQPAHVCSMLVHYSQAWLTVPVYACIFGVCVITHWSTVLSILISDLINKYNSLMLAPNMPCMLLVIQYKWIIIITALLRLLYILLWTGNKHTISSGLISGVYSSTVLYVRVARWSLALDFDSTKHRLTQTTAT